MLIEHNWLQQFIIIGQVILAMVLGGFIGFERELANKPAGFRTHTLVAGAAALFMAVAVAAPRYLYASGVGELENGLVELDPLRVAAAIVTGVSFLGAGTIFRGGGTDVSKVGGLTTAATIWLSAAVGVAVALGQLIVAIGVTVIALIVLRVMHRLAVAGKHHEERLEKLHKLQAQQKQQKQQRESKQAREPKEETPRGPQA